MYSLLLTVNLCDKSYYVMLTVPWHIINKLHLLLLCTFKCYLSRMCISTCMCNVLFVYKTLLCYINLIYVLCLSVNIGVNV